MDKYGYGTYLSMDEHMFVNMIGMYTAHVSNQHDTVATLQQYSGWDTGGNICVQILGV